MGFIEEWKDKVQLPSTFLVRFLQSILPQAWLRMCQVLELRSVTDRSIKAIELDLLRAVGGQPDVEPLLNASKVGFISIRVRVEASKLLIEPRFDLGAVPLGMMEIMMR